MRLNENRIIIRIPKSSYEYLNYLEYEKVNDRIREIKSNTKGKGRNITFI